VKKLTNDRLTEFVESWPGLCLKKEAQAMAEELLDLRDHCNTFCKCPSHGASLVQIPDGEFDD